MSNERRQINCLRCHRAKLLPDTDMSHPMPVIWCEKKNDRSPLILSGCGLADPHYGTTRIGRRHGKPCGSEGDKSRFCSEVEREYLRIQFRAKTLQYLAKVTDRSLKALRCLAYRTFKLYLSEQAACKRMARAGRAGAWKRRKNTFTPEQVTYLRDCYDRGYWPSSGYSSNTPHGQRQLEIRADILRGLVRLGPARTWLAVKSKVYRLSPSYQSKKGK